MFLIFLFSCSMCLWNVCTFLLSHDTSNKQKQNESSTTTQEVGRTVAPTQRRGRDTAPPKKGGGGDHLNPKGEREKATPALWRRDATFCGFLFLVDGAAFHPLLLLSRASVHIPSLAGWRVPPLGGAAFPLLLQRVGAEGFGSEGWRFKGWRPKGWGAQRVGGEPTCRACFFLLPSPISIFILSLGGSARGIVAPGQDHAPKLNVWVSVESFCAGGANSRRDFQPK